VYIKDDGYPRDLKAQYEPHVSSLVKVCLNADVIKFTAVYLQGNSEALTMNEREYVTAHVLDIHLNVVLK